MIGFHFVQPILPSPPPPPPPLASARPMRINQAPIKSAQTATAPGMSAPVPALADFRRIVVKVGSSLLVDAEAAGWHGGLARRARRRHRVAARGQARHAGGVVGRDRARPLGAQAAGRSAQARRFAGRRRGRPDRAGAHLVRGAGPARHHRRAGAGDLAATPRSGGAISTPARPSTSCWNGARCR